MFVYCDDSGRFYYKYQCQIEENFNFNDKGIVLLKQEDIFYVFGFGFDGLIGYLLIVMVKNVIGMILVIENYGVFFFKNGVNLGGVLEYLGIFKDFK